MTAFCMDDNTCSVLPWRRDCCDARLISTVWLSRSSMVLWAFVTVCEHIYIYI